MKKKNILYIVSTLVKAGPTNQLYYLIKYLDTEKFNPIILTLSEEPENSLLKKFENIGVEIIQLNLSRLKGLFIAKKRINKVIKDKEIDIIHSHFIRSDLLNLKFKIPGVITIRNNPFFVYPINYGFLLGNILSYFHFSIFKKDKIAIACSASLSDILLNKTNKKFNNITNGVDIDIYKPITKNEKINVKNNLNIPNNKKIFITITSSIPGKDPDTVISAFIKSEISNNSILFLAGKFDIKLKNKFNSYDNIIFLGKISNIIDYFKSSDYFISASLSEGMPNAVLEAGASGLPLILSEIDAHKEILKGLDKTFIFPVKNINELTEKINLITKEDYEVLSNNIATHIANNFSAQNMSEGYQKLYNKF